MQVVSVERAQAQVTIVNSDFGSPSVGQAANGFISCPPTTLQVGWTFDCPAGGDSGVQKNGSTLGAPDAPAGHLQTAYIRNLGAISQPIEFKSSGIYMLTFYLAARATSSPANTIQPIQVNISGNPQVFLPTSTSVFKPILMYFRISAPGQYILSFANTKAAACTDCTNFIREVAIVSATPPPTIADGPSDLYPTTSTIVLKGKDFGAAPGRIEIQFSSPSAINFEHGGNSELVLNANKAPHSWVGSVDDGAINTIKTEPILAASATGAVSEQTAWIVVNTADGRVSKGWPVKFHNSPHITGGYPTIHAGWDFNLTGWNFGEAGTLTINFPTQNPTKPQGRSINVPITGKWESWALYTKVPMVEGVVEQTVDMYFTTKDGQKSNTWKAKFNPTIVFRDLPYNQVTVVSCSNQSAADSCNDNGSFLSGDCNPFDALNLDPAGEAQQTDSIAGSHHGCWGASSDTGTDTYIAAVKNGWKIIQFYFAPASSEDPTYVDNGSIFFNTAPQVSTTSPATFMVISVPWHIGPDGGNVYYLGDILMEGPAGVPYQ